MKKVFMLISSILMVACSSPDPELVRYCDYHKSLNEISASAERMFPDSLKPLTVEEMQMPEHKLTYEERRQWVDKESQKIRDEFGITDSYEFEQNAYKKGWLPLTCKEQGIWKQSN
ncbi:hypothetical protein J7438_07020 [Thalassotalea sp. G20_0]|uniref:hypothetical protein n=1 Tax=Thalassotalea sp. G20_0 TaxID=2821093 RepID=UPI001ADCD896|nr:hypothetical protein [Thalassotalea sp. G20_0]MBO9493836.1 hypothetical protein [Thalassotalea sp. G20_0]